MTGLLLNPRPVELLAERPELSGVGVASLITAMEVQCA